MESTTCSSNATPHVDSAQPASVTGRNTLAPTQPVARANRKRRPHQHQVRQLQVNDRTMSRRLPNSELAVDNIPRYILDTAGDIFPRADVEAWQGDASGGRQGNLSSGQTSSSAASQHKKGCAVPGARPAAVQQGASAGRGGSALCGARLPAPPERAAAAPAGLLNVCAHTRFGALEIPGGKVFAILTTTAPVRNRLPWRHESIWPWMPSERSKHI